MKTIADHAPKNVAHGLLRVLAKILAVIMLIGSVGGIVTNVRFLQRHGFYDAHAWGALAGLGFSFCLATACFYLLRNSSSKGRDKRQG